MQKNSLAFLKILFVLVLIYTPFFMHLGNLPIRIWDEARLVANALEMQQNRNFLVPHFNGEPDMWNTKPPLMVVSQVLFLNLMGNQELSFRMPSAIAGALTCLLILFFSWRYLKSYWLGIISIMILITTDGYLGDHVGRTGDYDAMLVLFTTLSSLSVFLWTEKKEDSFIHLLFIGLTLGVLTKSVQALMFLPAIGLYLLFTRNLLALFRAKWLYIDLIIFVLIIGGYYFARESVNQGYLQAVALNELGGRFFETIENHKHDALYYLDLLYNSQFNTWFIFVFAGFLFAFTFTEGIYRRIAIFTALLSVSYLVIISLSGTKLSWYTAPVFPFFAILSALSIFRLYLYIISIPTIGIRWLTPQITGFIMLILFFFYPYYNIIDKVYKPRDHALAVKYFRLSEYLKKSVEGKNNPDGFIICHEGYTTHIDYYIDKLKEKGLSVSIKDASSLTVGDKVIYSDESIEKEIESKFQCNEPDEHEGVKFVKLISVKPVN
jgi:4-amino-4-deoxy-L-arabinose transferase-like glycosyltransferase